MKILKSITNFYNKLSPFGKILIFLAIILSLVIMFKTTSKEGMIDNTKILIKSGDAIYDDFYAGIYDYLVFSSAKNDYEVGTIINSTNPNEASIIADIGCGTGHHVNEFKNKNLKIIGVDKSPDMIEVAKEKFPDSNFIVGDALDNGLFKSDSLTHILCMYFTIYYIKDKRHFFDNAMSWLMPGGYLVVHLVERETFDPILPPGNPLYVVSPQKYAKERIIDTKITFEDFIYTSKFDLNKDKDIATFDEKFKYNNGKLRKQQQVLYMQDTSNIVNMAQDVGFIIQSKIDMVKCGYESQYLYVFVKPS
jgi:ubiquinone/menaquinone biosynthesis C-methylase UbiE